MAIADLPVDLVRRLVRSMLLVEQRLKGAGPRSPRWVASEPRPIIFQPDRDIGPFECMVPDTSGTGIEDLGDGRAVFLTTQTATIFNPVIWVNGKQPVDDGKRGRCRMAGDVPIKVAYDKTGTTPAAGDFVGIVPGTLKVRPKFPGLRAVSDGDTVEETVWVVRAPIMAMWGLLDGALAYDSSATASIYLDTDTDSTHNETVWEGELIGAAEEIASGSWVLCRLMNDGKIYVVNSDTCPA